MSKFLTNVSVRKKKLSEYMEISDEKRRYVYDFYLYLSNEIKRLNGIEDLRDSFIYGVGNDVLETLEGTDIGNIIVRAFFEDDIFDSNCDNYQLFNPYCFKNIPRDNDFKKININTYEYTSALEEAHLLCNISEEYKTDDHRKKIEKKGYKSSEQRVHFHNILDSLFFLNFSRNYFLLNDNEKIILNEYVSNYGPLAFRYNQKSSPWISVFVALQYAGQKVVEGNFVEASMSLCFFIHWRYKYMEICHEFEPEEFRLTQIMFGKFISEIIFNLNPNKLNKKKYIPDENRNVYSQSGLYDKFCPRIWTHKKNINPNNSQSNSNSSSVIVNQNNSNSSPAVVDQNNGKKMNRNNSSL